MGLTDELVIFRFLDAIAAAVLLRRGRFLNVTRVASFSGESEGCRMRSMETSAGSRARYLQTQGHCASCSRSSSFSDGLQPVETLSGLCSHVYYGSVANGVELTVFEAERSGVTPILLVCLIDLFSFGRRVAWGPRCSAKTPRRRSTRC